jgi:hypothetical protein
MVHARVARPFPELVDYQYQVVGTTYDMLAATRLVQRAAADVCRLY